MTKFENENTEWNMVECEAERIYAQNTQGEQSVMIQSDMKAWAISNWKCPTAEYKDIVDAYVRARGWTQSGFTGMEICG
jgi:hypothetical protein